MILLLQIMKIEQDLTSGYILNEIYKEKVCKYFCPVSVRMCYLISRY